ncbi:CAP domain-containing protein [Geodermatophilus sp. SYSU D00742]
MPAGPPPSSRIAAALGRWVSVLFRASGLRRVLPVFAVVLAVAGIAFAVPVVSNVVTSSSEQAAPASTAAAGRVSSGAGRSGGASSAPSAAQSGTVQMGVDGAPAAPAPAETPAVPETPAAEQPEPQQEAVPAAPADEPAPASPSTPATKPAPEKAPDRPAAAAEAPAPAPAPAPRAAPAPAPRAAAAPAAPGVEGQVLTLVNEARAAAGCRPLVADSALAAVARAHSADMRDRDYFSHDTPEGLSPFDRARKAGVGYARAENIAYGQADAAEVMDDWMTSSGHRANILDCELTKLGVGVAEGPGGPWWTQLFGA